MTPQVKPLVGELAYIYGITVERKHSCIAQLVRAQREEFMVNTMLALRTQGSLVTGATHRWHDEPHPQLTASKDESLCSVTPGDTPAPTPETAQ
ncbi:MAG: hypothetical protein ACXWG8_10285 [Usitatibacter sp.]